LYRQIAGLLTVQEPIQIIGGTFKKGGEIGVPTQNELIISPTPRCGRKTSSEQ
jgi:hypothetical protein